MKSLLAHLVGKGKTPTPSKLRLTEQPGFVDENAATTPQVQKRLDGLLSVREAPQTFPAASRQKVLRSANSKPSTPQQQPTESSTPQPQPRGQGDRQQQVPPLRLQRESSVRFADQQRPNPPKPESTSAASTAASTPVTASARASTQASARHVNLPLEEREGAAAKAEVSECAAAADGQPHLQPGSDNIKVIVRVRPPNDREHSLGGATCVHPVSGNTLRIASNAVSEAHTFSFDHVAQQDASQESIFRAAGRHIVENCLQGYNGCIFAYGQTGSGKTYTMLGGSEGSSSSGDESRGLIQRVFEHLFLRIREKTEEALGGELRKYMVRCSFLEIYNEHLTDLLNPSAANLAIREDIRKGVYVEGVLEEACTSVGDVIELLQQGLASRRVGETAMNDKSSRSHCVFTATLESKTSDGSGATNILFSRLHLVDLAGSERQKASGAAGERLREAASINKSLSTLGHVISSLVDLQNGRSRHVPYRDSRLTFLLQDSLGGNAKTMLIATVSPAAVNMAETLSTLRFADNAKRIKNKAVVNEDTAGEAAALRREIKRLREELAKARAASSAPASLNTSLNSVGPGPGAGPMVLLRRGEGSLGPTPRSEAHPAGQLPWVEGFGSPLRPLGSCDSTGRSPLPAPMQEGARRALVAALRREESACRHVVRLEAELRQMLELLKVKDQDQQRNLMILKLKDARLARIQRGTETTDSRVLELQQEVELLRAKLESHPEVKRFAMENLHMAQELERLQQLVDRDELRSLHSEIRGLRTELLLMAEQLERAQDEAVVQQALAESFKLEGDLVADHIRHQNTAEKDSRTALLSKQLAEKQQQLEISLATQTQLQLRVQELESGVANLKSELSPVRRKAQGIMQELDVARQESTAAALRASSELNLRSQAEVTVAQLQQQAHELRSAAQEQEEARRIVEAERDALALKMASMEQRCGSLSLQLQQEQAAAAERQADHQEALQQLDTIRRRLGQLESGIGGLQSELLEAHEALARQADEHEAAQGAAAERTAQTLRRMQGQLDAREGLVKELQQRAELLAQQKKKLEYQLRQREAELEDVGQSVGSLELVIAKHKGDLAQAAEEMERLRAGLAAQEKSAAATAAALPEKESQLVLARAEVKELRAKLREREEAVSSAQARLVGKDSELAELRGQMAAEVRDAASTVQQLLAAHAESDSLRQQLQQLASSQLEGEAVREQLRAAQMEVDALRQQLAAAAAHAAEAEGLRRQLREELSRREEDTAVARRELGELTRRLVALGVQQEAMHAEAASRAAAQAEATERLQAALAQREAEVSALQEELEAVGQSAAQAQLEELIAERAQWVEELQAARLQARAAVDAAEGMERRLAEVSEARLKLEAELVLLRERESTLEQELSGLTGQHNHAQRIQYHRKVKDENGALREEVGRLRGEVAAATQRYERARGELARLRTAAGKSPLPDWEEEERLRQSLAIVQADKIKLSREFEALAQLVMQLALDASGGVPPPSPGTDDIVMDFELGYAPEQLGRAARQALEELRGRSRDTQRSLADKDTQIQLLRETNKLERFRKVSAAAAKATAAGGSSTG